MHYYYEADGVTQSSCVCAIDYLSARLLIYPAVAILLTRARDSNFARAVSSLCVSVCQFSLGCSGVTFSATKPQCSGRVLFACAVCHTADEICPYSEHITFRYSQDSERSHILPNKTHTLERIPPPRPSTVALPARSR